MNDQELSTLTRELTKKWGEDAAQYALMKVVERGWIDHPGTHEVTRYAKVTAKNYRLDSFKQLKFQSHDSTEEGSTRKDEPLLRAEARQELSRQSPTALMVAYQGHAETAKTLGINKVTVRTRLHKGRKAYAQASR